MNKSKHRKKISPFSLCIVLMTSIALFTTGCSGNAPKDASFEAETEVSALIEGGVLGEGDTVFPLTVLDKEGNETQFEIHTDKETVGEALVELGLIVGEESGYGLFVKTVNGITADYDKDGVYWAFYINDEYAQVGVDSAKITKGEHYSFKVE